MRRALYIDHARRAGALLWDQALCRAVLASHARRKGNTFIYSTEIPCV